MSAVMKGHGGILVGTHGDQGEITISYCIGDYQPRSRGGPAEGGEVEIRAVFRRMPVEWIEENMVELQAAVVEHLRSEREQQ